MSERRKKVLLNPKFQVKLLSCFFALSFSMATIFYVAVLFFFWNFYQMGVDLGLPDDHVFFRFIDEQKSYMNWVYLGTSFLSMFALVFGGLVLSHKIAGPLYHLCEYIERKVKGEASERLSFREGDFFPEVQDSVNKLIDHYEGSERAKSDKAA